MKTTLLSVQIKISNDRIYCDKHCQFLGSDLGDKWCMLFDKRLRKFIDNPEENDKNIPRTKQCFTQERL